MSGFDETAKGLYIISVTPFTDSGELDLASTDRLMDFYLESGVTGVTILGILGEAPKLTQAESVAFSRHVVRRIAGRVPVVVGVSSPGFAAMADLTRAVMDDGASGVMVAPPSTVRTDDAAVAYYHNVAEAIGDVPFALQDYPLTTQVQLTPGVIRRIIDTVPSCVMVKHEDWPGLGKLTALRHAAGMRRVSILVGNNALFLAEEMRRGADGAMTGFAFPEMMTGVIAATVAGDLHRAADLFDAYLPLARYEQQPGPGLAARKYLLAKRGVIASAAQRRPRVALSEADIADVEFLLGRQQRRLRELGATPVALAAE
jgi:4-hydroxy-tetrahydrodipicolinate synthase